MTADVLDVSDLPATAVGTRAPLWWANAGLVAIESSMFAMILATYFYYGTTIPEWPPSGMRLPSLTLATVNVGILLVSALPAYWASEAVARHQDRVVLLSLLGNLLLALLFFGIRVVEWNQLAFRWDSGVYGSMIWLILALHTTHVLSASTETAVIIAILASRRLGDEHRVGIDVDSVYWYFVVAAWLPFYFVVYVAPRLR